MSWPHLSNIDLHELKDSDVMLVIWLQERPDQFLPLEYRVGSEREPIAVRYGLGWTVIGPVGGEKDDPSCSANFTRASNISFTRYYKGELEVSKPGFTTCPM